MLCPEEILLYQQADPLPFALLCLLWTSSCLPRCHLAWQSLESFHYTSQIQSMGIHMRGLGYKTEATARNSEKTLCQKQSEKLNAMRESKPPLLKHGYAKREYKTIFTILNRAPQASLEIPKHQRLYWLEWLMMQLRIISAFENQPNLAK